MKKFYFTGLVSTLFVLWMLLSSSSGGRATAANKGNTGAPNETSTCASCHSGGSYGTVSLTIQAFDLGTTNPVTTYTAGTQYDMRVTVNHTSGTPSGYGFQLTCLKQGANTPISGYSNLASNVKQKTITSGTYNGRTYCEHSGVTNNNIFNFRWTAPVAGTGTVVFYAAGDAVNGNGSDNGDKSGNSNLVLTESVAASLTSSATTTNVTCNGGTNGAINLSVTGGTPSYTYHWNDGTTTEDRSNVTAGTYTVTITDANSTTATASFTITQPSAISGSATASAILCNGGMATITVSATGGTQPYTGTGTFTAPAGNPSYTITDANGCTATASVAITQPTVLNGNATASAILCNGGMATVTVSATGGTPPYTGTGAFSAPAGSPTYSITDANGCATTTGVTITQPTPLTVSATNDTIPCTGGSATIVIIANGGTAPYTGIGSFNVTTPGNYNYSITDNNGCAANTTSVVSSSSGFNSSFTAANLQCNGICNGSIDVTVTGGTTPYAYNWSNGETTPSVTGLCAGSYQQTISDAANCTITNTYVVTEPAALSAVIAQVTDASNNNGAVDITVTGGTMPYTYSWSNGASTEDISQLNAGGYTVTVTDAGGCTANITATVNLINAITNISSNGFALYPNPATNQVVITLPSRLSNATITIVNVNGEVLRQQNTMGDTKLMIDVATLAAGTYFVKITTANNTWVKPLLKQ